MIVNDQIVTAGQHETPVVLIQPPRRIVSLQFEYNEPLVVELQALFAKYGIGIEKQSEANESA